MHSVGVKLARILPTLRRRDGTVRSAALRSNALSLLKACSMGLRSLWAQTHSDLYVASPHMFS